MLWVAPAIKIALTASPWLRNAGCLPIAKAASAATSGAAKLVPHVESTTPPPTPVVSTPKHDPPLTCPPMPVRSGFSYVRPEFGSVGFLYDVNDDNTSSLIPPVLLSKYE